MWCQSAQARWLHPVVLGTSATSSAAQVILEWNKNNQPGTSIISSGGDTVAEKYLNRQWLDSFVYALSRWAPVAFDWENAPLNALKYLENNALYLKPGWEVLETTQHRGREKAAINSIHGETITAAYEEVSSLDAALQAFSSLWAWRLKTCEWWYDGKGQWAITQESDLENAFCEMEKMRNIPKLVYEQNVPFTKELSVIVGRNSRWEFAWYDPFLNHHEWWILRTTQTGNIWVDQEVCENMIAFTKKVAEWLGLEWIMCMEMFLLKDGSFRANEIAARAHNSGHITQDTHPISQFDLQIMAMLDEPMPWYIRNLHVGKMTNMIGNDIAEMDEVDWCRFGTYFVENEVVTSYGKWEAKAGRKMWHKNVIY